MKPSSLLSAARQKSSALFYIPNTKSPFVVDSRLTRYPFNSCIEVRKFVDQRPTKTKVEMVRAFSYRSKAKAQLHQYMLALR